MKEISFSDWYYAITGLGADAKTTEEITALAEKGEPVVVYGEGKRHKPKKIPAHEIYWGLEPEQK